MKKLLKKLELNLVSFKKIKLYCKKSKINFLLSVFGVEELKTFKKLKGNSGILKILIKLNILYVFFKQKSWKFSHRK